MAGRLPGKAVRGGRENERHSTANGDAGSTQVPRARRRGAGFSQAPAAPRGRSGAVAGALSAAGQQAGVRARHRRSIAHRQGRPDQGASSCFLATGGRLKVSPIFLPILNYAPEGDSWFQTLSARWTQAKRHALGFSELVYLQDHAPRVFRSIEGRRAKAVFLWRLCFLWFKLLMIHIFMACFPVILPMNSLILGYFAKHELKAALTINSWTFLANCVAQGFGFLAFMGFFASSVRVYETVKHRIDGSATVSILWKSPTLHFLTFVPQSLVFLPLFFVLASAAEWIAAVKTARTHVFEYAVALKPKLPAV